MGSTFAGRVILFLALFPPQVLTELARHQTDVLRIHRAADRLCCGSIVLRIDCAADPLRRRSTAP
ncbi:MAG: hypothetical protein ACJAQZ_003966 [Planctomycetota bacterium]|jgi:hypothetical protein